MKIAIVIGHSASSKGAVNTDGVAEFTWNTRLAEQLEQQFEERGVECRIFRRRPGRYNTVVPALAQEVNRWGCDLVVALHFNASTDSDVAGAMALHWPGSVDGRHMADRLARAVSSAVGNQNLGKRAQAESWSGAQLWILSETDAPAVILEPYFGSNASDTRLARAALEAGVLADAIATTIGREMPC